MTGLERRWAAQVLSAFAPPGGAGLSPGPAEVDWLAALSLLRARATWLAATGLRIALWLVALAPLWHLRRLRTIGALSPQARSRLLASLLCHHSFAVRELTLLLKLCASLAMFASEGVRARSGYDRTVRQPLAIRSKVASARRPSSAPPPPPVGALSH